MSTRSTRHGWFVLRPGRRPSVSSILPNLLIGEYPEYDDIGWLQTTHGVTAVAGFPPEDVDAVFSNTLRAAATLTTTSEPLAACEAMTDSREKAPG